MSTLGVTSIPQAALYSSLGALIVPLLIDCAHPGDFGELLATDVAFDPPAWLELNLGIFVAVVRAEDIPYADSRTSSALAGSSLAGGLSSADAESSASTVGAQTT